MVVSQSAGVSGFTLLELAIAIVIIGLIIGGILIGADLITASELRSTIAQVERYNSAVHTFRTKYNAIPGDVAQADAGAYGIFQLTNAVFTGQGDNNGFIEGGGAGLNVPQGETLVFWRHLSDASLIDGSFGISGNSVIVAATGLVTGAVTTVANTLPPTKLTPVNFFTVYSANGYNYYQILPIASVTTAPAYTFSTSGTTPISAFNMDTKLDDGKPNTGAVIARGIAAINVGPSVNAASTAATCTVGTSSATDTYNRISATGGTDTSCSLRFRFN